MKFKKAQVAEGMELFVGTLVILVILIVFFIYASVSDIFDSEGGILIEEKTIDNEDYFLNFQGDELGFYKHSQVYDIQNYLNYYLSLNGNWRGEERNVLEIIENLEENDIGEFEKYFENLIDNTDEFNVYFEISKHGEYVSCWDKKCSLKKEGAMRGEVVEFFKEDGKEFEYLNINFKGFSILVSRFNLGDFDDFKSNSVYGLLNSRFNKGGSYY